MNPAAGTKNAQVTSIQTTIDKVFNSLIAPFFIHRNSLRKHGTEAQTVNDQNCSR